MFVSLAAVVALAVFPGSPVLKLEPVTLSADLDGDGAAETVTAVPRRDAVRIEVRGGARSKRIASSDAPAPHFGVESLSIVRGDLGSSGSLVEVVASAKTEECRSIWRLRDRALLRVPVWDGSAPLPDCGKAGEWRYGWDRAAGDATAEYRRERTRELPNGTHHQVQSFRYAGFRLEPDAARSVSEIDGTAIPSWYSAFLYPRSALDSLYGRFDLSAFKTGPRIRWRTDPSSGEFALEIQHGASPVLLPVGAVRKGAGRNELVVTFGGPEPGKTARVTLAGESTVPGETVLKGFGGDIDALYNPAMRMLDGALRVFPSAGDELASIGLVGRWTGGGGEQMEVAIASAEPLLLRVGNGKYRIEVERAPEGLDALLIAADGSGAFGLSLRGPNALERVPVQCEGSSPPGGCRRAGTGESLHRVGARVNAR